jgi:hypothetical protein
MKVALCFSGQPRFIARCYPNIRENILEPNGFPDVFVHTWTPEEHPKGHKIANNHVGDPDGVEQILKLYKPTSIMIEKPIEFPPFLPNENPYSAYQYIAQSMFYSIERSINLSMTHFTTRYDVLCRIRFDDIYHQPIKFSDYDSSYLNIPYE